MSNIYFKGDNVFLYIQFTDSLGQPCSAKNVQAKIVQDINGKLTSILSWTNLQQMSENEYFYNYTIPNNVGSGQYEILYKGQIGDNLAKSIEVFHIINKSEKYENAIRIYGYINDIKTNAIISDAMIQITDNNTAEFFQSLSDKDGHWEAYLYPGDYNFTFKKNGYTPMNISVQIGDENNEMQFNNISLESESSKLKGSGIYAIGDNYVTKQGTPLVGLNVKIYNINDLSTSIAQDMTNDAGDWECFLDPGNYMLKITTDPGKLVFGKSFNKNFRLRVDNNGKSQFEDLSKNVVAPSTESKIEDTNRGDGSIQIGNSDDDVIKDRNESPIMDVQVNAFRSGVELKDENIIAQDYTDENGEWQLNLDPGKYVLEFYHPKFKPFTKNIELK